MDYGNLVRRAWEVTKKNPWLWVLGFFAASSGGSFSFPSGSGGSSGRPGGLDGANMPDPEAIAGEAARWIEANWVIVAGIAAALFLITIILVIIGLAATGGLFSETARADAGERTSLRRGWSTGFSRIGRTFMIQFISGLPILIAVMIMLTGIGVAIIGGLSYSEAATGDSSAGPAIVGALVSGALFLGLLGLVIGILAFVIGAWTNLSLAAGIVEDRTFGMALRRGWQIIRHRFGQTLMILIIDMLIGIAVGFVMMFLLGIVSIPAILMFVRAGGVPSDPLGWIVIAGVALLVLIVSAVVGSMITTFSTALWTAFFRTVTGIDRPDPGVPAPEPVAPLAPPVD